jgi:hypothetical protein
MKLTSLTPNVKLWRRRSASPEPRVFEPLLSPCETVAALRRKTVQPACQPLNVSAVSERDGHLAGVLDGAQDRRLHHSPLAGALRQANAKFERRFRTIEEGLRARGRRLEEASLDEMEALWREAKARER